MRLALLVQLRLLQAVQVEFLLPLASQVAFQRLAQPVELQEQEQDAP
tara:strand:- start:122 stop:262 length:141 start_codon:yes stop_codon:yes gene_type:complete